MFELIFPIFRNIALIPFVVAALITTITLPAVIEIAKYFRLVDDPAIRPHPAHTETRVVPRAGGLALISGLVVTCLIFIPITKELAGILLGALILAIVGLIDDYHDVHPYLRLATNIIAASLAVAGGAGIPFITNPLTGGVIHLDSIRWTFVFMGEHSILPIADLIAILWISWTMNMVGWSGGVDGQLPGFVTIAAFTIGLLSFTQISIANFPAWTGTTLAFITAGIYFGFMPWNFFPQKIMPGYGGKSLAGYLLATLAILSTAKIGTAILVLGIPIVDSLYVKLGQILQGKNPTLGTRSFLHHRLLAVGVSKAHIALFYWGVSAILAVIALSVNATQKFFAIVVVAVAVVALILWLKHSSTFLKKLDRGNG